MRILVRAPTPPWLAKPSDTHVSKTRKATQAHPGRRAGHEPRPQGVRLYEHTLNSSTGYGACSGPKVPSSHFSEFLSPSTQEPQARVGEWPCDQLYAKRGSVTLPHKIFLNRCRTVYRPRHLYFNALELTMLKRPSQPPRLINGHVARPLDFSRTFHGACAFPPVDHEQARDERWDSPRGQPTLRKRDR